MHRLIFQCVAFVDIVRNHSRWHWKGWGGAVALMEGNVLFVWIFNRYEVMYEFIEIRIRLSRAGC